MDPERFASGVGHALIELYARLRSRGRPVSIGPRVPVSSPVVVWFPDGADLPATVAKRWQVARHAQVLIRGDRDASWQPPVEPDVTVVPNGTGDRRPQGRGTVRFIPLLPQRGLIPRDADRRGSLSTVAFKGNPENVPDYLRDGAFVRTLEDLGFTLRLDVPTDTDGRGNRWHDFAEVDVSLCVRAASPSDDLRRKPATRLINSWLAGAVPLVAPEPAYLELCRDGDDAFIVDGPDAIVTLLGRLKHDTITLQRVESAVDDRARHFLPSVIVERWDQLLFGTQWHRPAIGEVTRRRLMSVPPVAVPAILGGRGRRMAHRIRGLGRRRRTAAPGAN